jgi:hypothetical protein
VGTVEEWKNHHDHGVSMIMVKCNCHSKFSINRSICFIVKSSSFLYPKELRLSLIQSIQLLPPLICSPEHI